MDAAEPNPNFLCPITHEVMADPVIAPDGITYERAAIEVGRRAFRPAAAPHTAQEWLAMGNSTSPVTRQPLTAGELVPNYALKSLIAGGAPVVVPAPAPVPASTSTSTLAPPITITAERITGTTQYHVALSVPDVPTATMPTLFIDVLDISGSMGGSSVDTRRQAGSEAASLSRADLVRCVE